MGRLAVNGGNHLYGDISISGAKNSALPLVGSRTDVQAGLV